MVAMILFSFSAFSRQYIQCQVVDSWDGAIINLDGEDSTLFLTTGVHLPDEIRVLKNLAYDSEDEKFVTYVTNEGPTKDSVSIPKSILGKHAQNFSVYFNHSNAEMDIEFGREMICFSAIYEN